MISVSVIIPTFRRPEGFLRAARSVLAQQGVVGVEIVAVDNSPEAGARQAFAAFEAETSLPLRWAHEPKPGVAQARNSALRLARGDLVAWLDDDEEASPTWLASLVETHRRSGAQSVFGPVRAQAPEGAAHARYFERLYSRRGPATDGPLRKPCGIGNSLQPRALFAEPAPFDTRADQRGGEDDRLFAQWAQGGAEFAWAADALVIEHIGRERTRLAHGLKRAFAYGQGPSLTAWTRRDIVSLARHMLQGVAQATLCAIASVLVAATGATPRALTLLDLAARGAGKVCWFAEQRFYGATLAVQRA